LERELRKKDRLLENERNHSAELSRVLAETISANRDVRRTISANHDVTRTISANRDETTNRDETIFTNRDETTFTNRNQSETNRCETELDVSLWNRMTIAANTNNSNISNVDSNVSNAIRGESRDEPDAETAEAETEINAETRQALNEAREIQRDALESQGVAMPLVHALFKAKTKRESKQEIPEGVETDDEGYILGPSFRNFLDGLSRLESGKLDLGQRVDDLEKKVAELEKKKDTLETDNADLEKKNERYWKKYSDSKMKNDELEKKVAELEKEAEFLETANTVWKEKSERLEKKNEHLDKTNLNLTDEIICKRNQISELEQKLEQEREEKKTMKSNFEKELESWRKKGLEDKYNVDKEKTSMKQVLKRRAFDAVSEMMKGAGWNEDMLKDMLNTPDGTKCSPRAFRGDSTPLFSLDSPSNRAKPPPETVTSPPNRGNHPYNTGSSPPARNTPPSDTADSPTERAMSPPNPATPPSDTADSPTDRASSSRDRSKSPRVLELKQWLLENNVATTGKTKFCDPSKTGKKNTEVDGGRINTEVDRGRNNTEVDRGRTNTEVDGGKNNTKVNLTKKTESLSNNIDRVTSPNRFGIVSNTYGSDRSRSTPPSKDPGTHPETKADGLEQRASYSMHNRAGIVWSKIHIPPLENIPPLSMTQFLRCDSDHDSNRDNYHIPDTAYYSEFYHNNLIDTPSPPASIVHDIVHDTPPHPDTPPSPPINESDQSGILSLRGLRQ